MKSSSRKLFSCTEIHPRTLQEQSNALRNTLLMRGFYNSSCDRWSIRISVCALPNCIRPAPIKVVLSKSFQRSDVPLYTIVHEESTTITSD
jgi:hypothetical protein